jgi:hypothetical protein
VQSGRNLPTFQMSLLPLKGVLLYTDDGGGLFLRSIGTCLPAYTASYCRRQQSSLCKRSFVSLIWYAHFHRAEQVGANGDVYDLFLGSCFESRPEH